jgi:ABC-2 type transport system ATP-binding protein
MPYSVQIKGISKRFRLFHERYSSLKERVIHFGRIPYDDFWALRNIDMEIEEGETIGLLGHNGSGKSTLLKCVAGILQPTTGEIRTCGRVAALLELGAGFHPDLSGRENVFLNASLLGLSRREVTRRFDEIVAFAELEEHIDQQVKYYSSGMYVRLGFAVAVNMDPDILLIDEVLAVGDESFQRKCLERVRQFQHEGRTIVFVTHSVDLVRQTCDRVAVLDHGDMVTMGSPAEAVRSYREHLTHRERREEDPGAGPDPEDQLREGDHHQDIQEDARRSSPIRITSVRFEYPQSSTQPYLVSGQPLTIHMGYRATEAVEDVVAGLAIYNVEGTNLFGSNTELMGRELGCLEGEGEISFSIGNVPLLDGTYPIIVTLHTHGETRMYDWRDHEDRFEVMSPTKAVGQIQLPLDVHLSQSEVTRKTGAA